MLICNKCGYDNELGRIFCQSCSTKLDLSSIKAPTPAQKKLRQVKRGSTHVVGLIIKLAIAVAVLVTIGLLWLTPTVAPVTPTNDELVATDSKFMNLDKLVTLPKPGTVTVTTSELNTFFNQRPFDKPTGSAILVAPAVRRISLHDGRVKVDLLVTAHLSTYYDKLMCFTCEGQPTIADGHFVFQPTGAWLNQLPIYPRLPFLMPLFEERMAGLLQDLTGNQTLLDKLTAINVTGDSVEFVKAAPAKP